MDLNELKSMMSRFNLKAQKSLGQNFLLNDEVLDEIVTVADISKDDFVVEVGPGLGVLTKRLGEKAGTVLAIEKDRKLVKVLRKIFKSKKNIKIKYGDALFLNPDEFGLRDRGYKLVANLPYYITGKFLQNMMNAKTKPAQMVLLLQKEVAERIVAGAGQMSVLAISCQLFADCKMVKLVERKDFYPEPEVDSAVVKFDLLKKPRLDVDPNKFMRLVKIGFSGKRKMLANNLGAGLQIGKSDSHKLLESSKIAEKSRAQELSLEDWERLYNEYFSS